MNPDKQTFQLLPDVLGVRHSDGAATGNGRDQRIHHGRRETEYPCNTEVMTPYLSCEEVLSEFCYWVFTHSL
jgi:hypothetical protein